MSSISHNAGSYAPGQTIAQAKDQFIEPDTDSLLSNPMPEIRFQIQWSDGSQDICYSPSLIVKEYFLPNTE